MSVLAMEGIGSKLCAGVPAEVADIATPRLLRQVRGLPTLALHPSHHTPCQRHTGVLAGVRSS